MLSRFAIRPATLAARRSAAAFHVGGLRLKDDKESTEVAANHDGIFQKFGLDDWKISAPIVLACTIPALSNGFYELGAESQLACCFLLFCTSAYKFGGEAVGSFFEARANAILAYDKINYDMEIDDMTSEQNAVEDANLAVALETLKTHESILTMRKDIETLGAAHEEALALMCHVQSQKLRHKTRDVYVKNLEAIHHLEQGYNQQLQDAMISQATNNVRTAFSAGKKAVKTEAFQMALDVLSEKPDDNKQDPVAAAFGKELRAFAENLEKQQGTNVKLSEEEHKQLQGEVDAFLNRLELHNGDVKAPTEIKMKLI
ncbi:hypothetical protein THRCLA_08413 [Thraustotheca clavata]|uniref:Uncharacterized protein n=1 Tax=Thraustotheca clavata TaxID=74557 RepID=A0A1V9Z6H7_9STRA|nr:hypothetical protein THRCLA_08413 [Thraustotheca clavata]